MDVLGVSGNFDTGSAPVSYKECGIGHINSTFFIKTENGPSYVLQRINTSIFKDPEGLMKNIVAVTTHISNGFKKRGIDPYGKTLDFIRVRGTDRYCYEDSGSFFRMYRLIEGVTTLQFCDSPEVFGKVGRAFGNFQNQLADFDASGLSETIPGFHNTEKRYENFLRSLSDDRCSRAGLCQGEIAFVKEREKICGRIVRDIGDGTISLRVTHNDTKLNNLLLDEKTLEPQCVIDLDTVMPGSVLYDFGDAIRSGAATQPEDSSEYGKCGVDTDMFEAFAKGFISSLGTAVPESEIRLFPFSALLMTFENGMRFLTDYLDGDVYFRTEYPEHNLVRARNQFAMVADIEKKMPKLNSAIEKILTERYNY